MDMHMALDVQGVMNRVVALEKEALAALSPSVTCDAVPRFWHVQESFPFWTNRLSSIEVAAGTTDYGEEFDSYTYNVSMRLIIGHITGSYTGEKDTSLQTYIPQVIQYFNERELLQSAAYPAAPDDLIRARMVSCTGYTQFVNNGSGSTQVGTEFTLRCEFAEEIEQQYL
jgi:hypothetical protein